MISKLIGEIRRRRLWPVPALAVVVAVVAPVLLLSSGPSEAPLAATSAPASPQAAQLPERARRLLASSDATPSSARRPARRAGDPFLPPASRRSVATPAGAAAPQGSAAPSAAVKPSPAASTMKPVPVVITNADGSTPASQASRPAPRTTSTPRVRAGAPIGGEIGARTKARMTAVDVRFGKTLPGRAYRGIPRRQTFVAGGRVLAIFVKYSPNRRKAVFAVGPHTLVQGVSCRRKHGVCRYVDVAAGKHVSLTTRTASGKLVRRRLDVLRTALRPATAFTRAAPRDGSCLLDKLLKVSILDPPLASDACPS